MTRFKSEVSAFSEGRKDAYFKDVEWASWNDDFRVVAELMEGKAERVLEEANDWREAVGAWGVLVDVGSRRDDLP